MLLGSRWQALLFLLLKSLFSCCRMPEFWKGWFEFPGICHLLAAHFLNHLCCSLCIIVFLLNAEVNPLFFKWQMDTNQYMSSIVFSYGFSRKITNTKIKNKWDAVTVNPKLFALYASPVLLLLQSTLQLEREWYMTPSFKETSSPKGAYTSISASNNWEGKWTENLVCLFPGAWCLSPLRELLVWCSCLHKLSLQC